MSIVITTPTGKIGSKLAELLVEAGESVTLIARHPEKVRHLADRGARVIQGSHNDQTVVDEATVGAKALFWLTPPNMGSTDIRSFYRSFGEVAANAIEKNHIPHVVHLSSLGAELDTGTGPVLGLHDVEPLLAQASENIVQLRPAYFMENTFWQIPAIKAQGKLFTTFAGEANFPMIATSDIAGRAADLLRDRSWRGEQVKELAGPTELSFNDIAGVLSEVLALDITHIGISREQSTEILIENGVSEHMAEMMNDLSSSVESGRVFFRELQNPESRTQTAFPVFAKEVFKPVFDSV